MECPSCSFFCSFGEGINHLAGFFLDDLSGDFFVDVFGVPGALLSDGLLDLGGNFTDWHSDDLDFTADTVVEGGDGGVSELLLSKVQVDLGTGGEFNTLIGVVRLELLLHSSDDVGGLGEIILNNNLLVGVESLLGIDDGIDVEEVVSDSRVEHRHDDFIDEGISTVSANDSLEGGLDTLFGECLLNDGLHISNDILGDIDFHLYGVISVSIEVIAAWFAVGLAPGLGVNLSKNGAHLDGLGSGEEKSEGKVESHDDSVWKKFLFFVLQRDKNTAFIGLCLGHFSGKKRQLRGILTKLIKFPQH